MMTLWNASLLALFGPLMALVYLARPVRTAVVRVRAGETR